MQGGCRFVVGVSAIARVYPPGTCGVLFELQNANPPRKSFIANPRVSLADLNLLPAEILSSNGDDEEKGKEQVCGLTVSKAVAPEDIEKRSSKVLTLRYGGFRQSFWESRKSRFQWRWY